MEEVFYVILGSFMIYAMIHFTVIQFKKNWVERTGYERFITIFALVSIGLLVLGIMFGE